MTQKLKFKVEGIKCSSCPILIEDRVKNMTGVAKIKVSQESNIGIAVYDDKKTTSAEIFGEIEKIGGFSAEEIIDKQEENNDNKEADNTKIKCPHCGKAISICVK